MGIKFIVFAIAILFVSFFPNSVSAQGYTSSQFIGEVSAVLDEKTVTSGDIEGSVQTLQVTALEGELEGREIVIKEGQFVRFDQSKYEVGDRIVITQVDSPDGASDFYVSDYVRRDSLFLLFVLFAIVTITIGRWSGFASLIGMAASFAILFFVVLPLFVQGVNPVFAALLAVVLIAPVTFYLSHGVSRKTHIAILSTIITLTITTLLALVTVEFTHLTGFASEEAGFLQSQYGGTINMRGLLLAGIIIGALGVLDDITISQASIVQELKASAKKKDKKKIFSSAMRVGRDHIASLVNTLILVYTGASLPLLLLFVNSDQSIGSLINLEIIADEIVRTLVGSIGLVLAVPITTLFAVYWSSDKLKKNEHSHSHAH